MSELTTDHEPRYLVVQRFHGDGWFAIKATSKGARRETLDAIATDDEFFGMVAENPKRKWIAWGVSVGAACEALDAKNAPTPEPAPEPTSVTLKSIFAEQITPKVQEFRDQVLDEVRKIVEGRGEQGEWLNAAKVLSEAPTGRVAVAPPPAPPARQPRPLSPYLPGVGEKWAMHVGKWRDGEPRDTTGHPIVLIEAVFGGNVYTVSNWGSDTEARRTYKLDEFRIKFIPTHAPDDQWVDNEAIKAVWLGSIDGNVEQVFLSHAEANAWYRALKAGGDKRSFGWRQVEITS